MAATPPPDTTARPALRPDEEGTSFGAWTLVWVLYGAKAVTIALVVWAEHSYRMALFVTITTWFWLGPLLVIGSAPLLFRYRLRRVRARRALLLREEWEAGDRLPASLPGRDDSTP
jgi:hypothetical protein